MKAENADAGAALYPGAAMAAVVLESASVSQYPDTPLSYTFPERYLKPFEPLRAGEAVQAVIYEPRGDDGKGRMAYLGLATISTPPFLTGQRSANGQRLWRVEYDGPAIAFDQAVPREILGEPVEGFLRQFPRGIRRNQATRGQAVRVLPDADFERIVLLGNAVLVEASRYPTIEEHAQPLTQVRERNEYLVRAVRRNAQFRQDVLGAYGQKCAVSGFTLGPVSPFTATSILEAAHIRPVKDDGTDLVGNGLPLTPTLHNLFDIGLFTVRYEGQSPVIRTSPQLTPTMISSPDRGFSLPLADGLRLITPTNQADWPNRDQLEYHERRIFRAS
jgi:putative restriction endonuclease